jgi:polyhydroxybutyrate depolymerase
MPCSFLKSDDLVTRGNHGCNGSKVLGTPAVGAWEAPEKRMPGVCIIKVRLLRPDCEEGVMSKLMKWGVALLTMAAAFGQPDAGAEEIAGRITVGGLERSYIAVLPDGAERRRLPTVIVLHGALMDGRWMRKTFGFDSVGQREGVLAVYPNGVRRIWNDGRNVRLPFWRRNRERADDVAFVTALARRLADDGLADPRRTYLLGVSNGGMLAFRTACESPATFAAVGAVIASMPVDVAATCNPGRAVPMIVINATNDRFIPWNGGALGPGGRHGAVVSTPQTVDFWRRNNGCAAQPSKRPLPDKNAADGSTVDAEQYAACDSGAPVVLVTVEGGGHLPPGAEIGERPLITAILGKGNKDISAADLSWRFFRQFPGGR